MFQFIFIKELDGSGLVQTRLPFKLLNCQQVDKWPLCCVVVSVVEASEKTAQNSCKLHPQTWWRGKFMRLKNKSAMLCIELVKSAQGRNTASVFGSSGRDEMSQTRT